MNNIVGVEIQVIGSIDNIAKSAIHVAALLKAPVTFSFNGVTIHISEYCDWRDAADSAMIAVRNGTKEIWIKEYRGK